MPSPAWPGAPSDAVHVGIDLGTSGLKAVAVDAVGTVVARASRTYPTARPSAGAAEQDPADWIVALVDAVTQIGAVVPPATWTGVSLSAMLPTLVCLDDDNHVVGPALTWEDSRAESWGNQLRQVVGEAWLYERTGQHVDGRYLLPMWARINELEPQRASRIARICGAKDYIYFVLTGELLTDPSTAAGFGCYDLRDDAWLPHVQSAIGGRHELPTIRPSAHRGVVSAAGERATGLPAGLPVVLGAADSVLGALGMGAAEPGSIAYVAGSSTVILGTSAVMPNDSWHRFLVTPMAQAGTWGMEMDLLATGTAVAWATHLLGYPTVTEAMAGAARAQGDIPSFLPYVSPGEQGALWDASLAGAAVGLHLGHGRDQVMRGLVEGIVVESMRCVDVLRDFGCSGDTVKVAGGSALDPWFRQLLADACGMVIAAPADGDSDYSALGAAALLGAPMPQALVRVEPAGPRQPWLDRLGRNDAIRVKLHG